MFDTRCLRISIFTSMLFFITQFGGAEAGALKIVHAFTGGADGGGPFGNLISDRSGNLYGTTGRGGDTNSCSQGCGTVYKITPDGTETVLHAFTGGADGYDAIGGLVADKSGNLYGTTFEGGSNSRGTVFRIAPDGSEEVLYAFGGSNDGYEPFGLVLGEDGNLYGTTYYGGAENCGTIYMVTPSGVESVLHTFCENGESGANPEASMIMDQSGNCFGTTVFGGATNAGTVFELSRDGTFSVLYTFQNGNDGARPVAPLLSDGAGNLFGTTSGYSNDGTLFKLSSSGNLTILYDFPGRKHGAGPEGGLFADKAGNLWGTTFAGGADRCRPPYGCGTVFKYTPKGVERGVHDLHQGGGPFGGLILVNGYFYGTVSGIGGGNGYVYRFKR